MTPLASQAARTARVVAEGQPDEVRLGLRHVLAEAAQRVVDPVPLGDHQAARRRISASVQRGHRRRLGRGVVENGVMTLRTAVGHSGCPTR